MSTTLRTNWKKRQARVSNLLAAIELCVDFARERHNRSVERIAELMGIPSHWNLYKYMQSGKLPANLIPVFEHACGCSFVSAFLATRSNKLVIDMPTGKRLSPKDINALQGNFSEAVAALIKFYDSEGDAEDTLAQLTALISKLAGHRANVQKDISPELALFDNGDC